MVRQKLKKVHSQVCMADEADQITCAFADHFDILHVVEIGQAPSLCQACSLVKMDDIESTRPDFEAFVDSPTRPKEQAVGC